VNVSGRLRPGAEDFQQIPGGVPEDALGHVAAARVTRTQDENFRFVHSGEIFDMNKCRLEYILSMVYVGQLIIAKAVSIYSVALGVVMSSPMSIA
jgi:hypothetical protein